MQHYRIQRGSQCPSQRVGWIGTLERKGDAVRKNWIVSTTIGIHTIPMPHHIIMLVVITITVTTTTLCITTTRPSRSRSRNRSQKWLIISSSTGINTGAVRHPLIHHMKSVTDLLRRHLY